jgi:cell division protein FtsZ
MAIMGIGIASGENRAVEAAEHAISHPLLEDISIAGATGVLMNITCASDITMEEMSEASDRIYNEVGDNADIIWGTVVDDTLEDEMRVTVIATGIGGDPHANMVDGRAIPELRGRIRDVTPADLKNAVDYDEPTFIRRQQAVGESSGATYRGYKGIVMDNNDLDVPTFLRKKAD